MNKCVTCKSTKGRLIKYDAVFTDRGYRQQKSIGFQCDECASVTFLRLEESK